MRLNPLQRCITPAFFSPLPLSLRSYTHLRGIPRVASYSQPHKCFFHATRPVFSPSSSQDEENAWQTAEKLAQYLRSVDKKAFPMLPWNSLDINRVGIEQTLKVMQMALAMQKKEHMKLTDEVIQEITASYNVVKDRDWTSKLQQNPFVVVGAAIDHAIETRRSKTQKISDSSSNFLLEMQKKQQREAQREANERRIQEEHQAREAKKIQEELDSMKAAKDLASSTPSSTPSSPSSTPTSPSSIPTSLSTSPSPSSTPTSPPPLSSSAAPATTAPTSSLPKTGSTSELPKLPWLLNVNVNSLGSPKWASYFFGMWYRGSRAGLSSAWDFRPSRLLAGALKAIESFAANLQEGNLQNLRSMVSPPIYKYLEKVFATYEAQNVKLVLNMQPITEGFFIDYGFSHVVNPQNYDVAISLIPGEGPGFEEADSLMARRTFPIVGYAFWQIKNNTPQEELKKQIDNKNLKRSAPYIYFSVYVNCKETYYLQGANGQLIEGSTTVVENGHIFTFFSQCENIEWKIVDVNGFNDRPDEDVPLFQIQGDKKTAVLHNYKKSQIRNYP